jgi:hypothetical protein
MGLRLIHWDSRTAEERCAALTALGFQVDGRVFDRESLKEVGADPPEAILIDLTLLPSQGRDLAIQLRRHAATRYIPLIFIGGDPVKVERIKGLLPDASYTDWETCEEAIAAVLSSPPEVSVVPESAFAAYSSTPLWKKLGVAPGFTVVLCSAPERFESLLEDCPGEVRVKRDDSSARDLTLWFVREEAELIHRIEGMAGFAESGGLWVIWPKSSSRLKSDLSQTIVRKVGLANRLVDFKICSVDDSWSGLRFTSRKQAE